ncbi:MAG: glycine cleavage T C-terminal barrel domain-containing protein [Pseudomonadota bacterium]
MLIEIDSATATAHAGETVFDGETPVGTITSAAWGYRVQKNLALAYINPDKALVGTELSVFLAGKQTPATVVDTCLYDPDNAIPRGQL